MTHTYTELADALVAIADRAYVLHENDRKRLKEAADALRKMDEPCVWVYSYGDLSSDGKSLDVYRTTCGDRMRWLKGYIPRSLHCENCGHPVKIEGAG